MSRIGVFGGSFDPPHYGHLALAETARVQLHLDCVLFVPAGKPPHKQAHTLSAPEHRVAMVQAAIADNAAFALSRVDVDRPGPHYTADMLGALQSQHSADVAWFMLMGEDSFRDLPQWYRPADILHTATLVVMPRRERDADVAPIAHLAQLDARLVWLDISPVHLSATALRRRVRLGLPLRYLVPPGVAAYIHKLALYCM